MLKTIRSEIKWWTMNERNEKKNTSDENEENSNSIRIGIHIIILTCDIFFVFLFFSSGFLFDSCIVWNTLWRFAQLSEPFFFSLSAFKNKKKSFNSGGKILSQPSSNTCHWIQIEVMQEEGKLSYSLRRRPKTGKKKSENMESHHFFSVVDKRFRTYTIAWRRYEFVRVPVSDGERSAPRQHVER